MTATRDAKGSTNRILIVSENSDLATKVGSGFSSHGRHDVSIQASSLAEMNGRAIKQAKQQDVVIFEAPAGEGPETDALTALLQEKTGETLYFALADEHATIADARRLREAGIDEVIPNTVSADQLESIVSDLLKRTRTAAATPSSHEGVVLPITQSRGGVGSTTVAVNLARALVGRSGTFRKRQKSRVALVDFDIQFGNANVLLDLEDNGSMAELINRGSAPDASDVVAIMQQHPSGVDLLSAPHSVVPLDAISPKMVGDLLDLLRSNYDYVVVDMPRALVEWISPILQRATTVYMVMEPDVPSVRQARRLFDTYREELVSLPVEFVVNRRARPMFKSQQIKEAESVLETKLQFWLPDAPRETKKAADLGQPVVELYPRSKLSKAIELLAASSRTLTQHKIELV